MTNLLPLSRAEYVALDAASPDKHEFLDGQVFAMAGGSFRHSLIGLNAATTLRQLLRGKPCQPMNSDMRIHTPSGLDTYPDVSAFCQQAELIDFASVGCDLIAGSVLRGCAVVIVALHALADLDGNDVFASFAVGGNHAMPVNPRPCGNVV